MAYSCRRSGREPDESVSLCDIREERGVKTVPSFIRVETEEFFIEKYTLKKPMADMHFHNAYELYYVLDGSRDYFIEDGFFKVHNGELVVVPPGALHRTAGKGATRFLVFFTSDFLERFFSKPLCRMLIMPLRPVVLHPLPADRDRLTKLLISLLQEYESYQKEKNAEREAGMALLLSDLLRLMAKLPDAADQQEKKDSRLAQIVKYINENFNEIASIEDITTRFYISKYYFCKLFRKNMGISLFAYINTLKIQKACEIMRNEKCTLTEIATRCGFNTSSYFCKTFKKIIGISPSEYRKQ